jgi:predicted HTH domain antitoxin
LHRSDRQTDTLQLVARRKPKTLLEVKVLFAAASLMTEEQRAANKRLPLMEQGRLMVKAMPKAMRMGELIAMWTITKYQEGAVSIERLAEVWGEPPRTMYRRLAEFRECWGIAGYETPDQVADALIADYRRRQEKLNAGSVGKLLSASVSVPGSGVPGLAS